MKLESSWFWKAGLALWLSVIFTLYLAPTPEKYRVADGLVMLLLVPALVAYRTQLRKLLEGVKPLLPLLVLIVYVALQTWLLDQSGEAGWHYAQELLYGLVPYALFYLIFLHLSREHLNGMLVVLLILPGLVHIAYLYLDIFLSVRRDEIEFLTSAKQGLMEYVKNAPRVGRRYLSVALLHLLGGGLLLAWYTKSAPLRYTAWSLAGVSMLSLALLDARAAYASMAIGALLFAWAIGRRETWHAVKRFLRWHPLWKLALVVFVIAVCSLGYSAGKSRWVAMSYSFDWAANDVLHAQAPLSKRPYVDMEFWNAPIENVHECYLSGQFRCRADQSAYLRMAWLLEGAESLVKHPFGIGYSPDYMGRLWGVEGDKTKFQRIDSFLVEHVVSFGWPAILLYGWFFWLVVASIRGVLRAGHGSVAMFVAGAIVLACAGRMLVDVFSEGLWRYLMAMMGICYGLLHASVSQARRV